MELADLVLNAVAPGGSRIAPLASAVRRTQGCCHAVRFSPRCYTRLTMVF